MFTHILLAADGSAHSVRACERAVFIAQKSNADITLIHVVDDLPARSDVADEEMRFREVPEHRKKRVDTIVHMLEKSGVSYTVHHIFGEPGPSIVRESKDRNADLVVLGSRGLNQFQQMVLGSVSHKVAKRAECPVMIVK
ncbi:universal stress protein [Alkalicoccus urumqiensis]|uniref:Universal stress protein n=1 Tax=Alkalicoccus urumqiensis TaxID=1548213 RepID=A0A2P6MDQ2_ALKUR|nr:universal stress protein [Alkalicoccus urumqiensis]PRO64421.1 universal stress protein [Alkalicoccus urumqiensis]